MKIRAEGQTGRMGIWEGEDNAPFDDPTAHLDRVKFHSDFGYTQILSKRTVQLQLPQIGRLLTGRYIGIVQHTAAGHTDSHRLFNHGLGGVPWVLAAIRNQGRTMPVTGSVPVQVCRMAAGDDYPEENGSYARWVSIGADNQSVWAHVYCLVPYDAKNSQGQPLKRSDYYYPAITLNIDVWITDELL